MYDIGSVGLNLHEAYDFMIQSHQYQPTTINTRWLQCVCIIPGGLQLPSGPVQA